MLDAPPSPFGRDWDALRLRDVRSFFAGCPSERAIWEAKRHTEKARLAGFVREASCAFANRRGGYLVLGAEDESDGTWRLSGVDIPGVRELHDWVSSLLAALDPVPDFDVHEWRLSNSRSVVVVQVAPAPMPPVTFNGVVYLRRGSQTVRADAAGIRRLAEAGRLARGRVERPARRLAQSGAKQLFSAFGLAVGHMRGRPFQRTDPMPESVASAELEAVLQGRWRKRQFTRLVAAREARGPVRQQQLPTGWLTGWEIAEPRRGGDRDDWLVQLIPDEGTAHAWKLVLPARRTDFRLAYGRTAIASAALLLRAILKTELRLGAAPGDSVFTCLCLAGLHENSYVSVERWDSFDLRAHDWEQGVAEAAGRRMDLSASEPPPPRPSAAEGGLFRVTSSRRLTDREARTGYQIER